MIKSIKQLISVVVCSILIVISCLNFCFAEESMDKEKLKEFLDYYLILCGDKDYNDNTESYDEVMIITSYLNALRLNDVIDYGKHTVISKDKIDAYSQQYFGKNIRSHRSAYSFAEYQNGIYKILKTGFGDDYCINNINSIEPMGNSKYNIIMDVAYSAGFDEPYVHKYTASAVVLVTNNSKLGFNLISYNTDAIYYSQASTDNSFKAFPSKSVIIFNSKPINIEAYNIDGNNYFKLRDLASMLNGSSKQFDIEYNQTTKGINILTGKAYTPVGSELALSPDNYPKAAVSAEVKLYLGAKEIVPSAYNINGNNFFKLRDLGSYLGFDVAYDELTKTIRIDASGGQSDEYTLDFTYQNFPEEFIQKTRENLALYNSGNFLAPANINIETIADDVLRTMTSSELETLEICIFAKQAGMSFYEFSEMLSSNKIILDEKQLNDSTKTVIEKIRIEKERIENSIQPIKSGDKVDLDGDGISEVIRFKYDDDKYIFTVWANNQKYECDTNLNPKGMYVAALNKGTNQKMLIFNTSVNQFETTYCLMYGDNKFINVRSIDNSTRYSQVRCNGDGLIYAALESPPFYNMYKYTISPGGEVKKEQRKDLLFLPLEFCAPKQELSWWRTNDTPYNSITMKTIDGGSLPYKDGESFTVIAYQTEIIEDDYNWEYGEYIKYIALLDKNGNVVMLSSNLGDFILGSERYTRDKDKSIAYPIQIEFASIFKGASFVS